MSITPKIFVLFMCLPIICMENASTQKKELIETNRELYCVLFDYYKSPDFKRAKELIAQGANVNQRDEKSDFKKTLLHEAVGRRGWCVDVVKFLLEYGADKYAQDARGRIPYHYAIQLHNGWQELINLLK